MKKDIVIVGARGLAKEMIGYLESDDRYRVVCLLDELDTSEICGYEVVSPGKYNSKCRDALFAIGYPNDKNLVLKMYSQLELNYITYIHSTSLVSQYSSIGTGVIAGPFTVIAGNCRIGNFVFINAFAAIGHDCNIDDYSSLMPYACLNGDVSLGKECLLATRSTVLPKCTIGDRCRVSAGAVVNRCSPTDSLLFGNPAQIQPDISMLKAKKIDKERKHY
jgi:sugar O-acyltransferase (sialic acid O-acetyltransferase NeuD family)